MSRKRTGWIKKENVIITKFKKGLLLVGDKSSFSPAKTDKSTYPIFGDAGTATLLEYDSTTEEMHFNLQSDGAGYKAIIIPDGGMRNSYNEDSDNCLLYTSDAADE